MLKTGNISLLFSKISQGIEKTCQENGARDPLAILVTGEGNLLASSLPNDSNTSTLCQRVAAVAASIAVEYSAMNKIMDEPFSSFTFCTEERIVSCSRFCRLGDTGFVLLVVSVAISSNANKTGLVGLLKSVVARLNDDLVPSMGPILENMISVPPTE